MGNRRNPGVQRKLLSAASVMQVDTEQQDPALHPPPGRPDIFHQLPINCFYFFYGNKYLFKWREKKIFCWLSSSPKPQKKAAVSVDSIARLRTLTEQWTSNRLCFSVQSRCNITCKYPDIMEQEKQVFYKMHDQCKLLFLAF